MDTYNVGKEAMKAMKYNDGETDETNIAKALWAIARELRRLGTGDAASFDGNEYGAIELLGMQLKNQLEDGRESTKAVLLDIKDELRSISSAVGDLVTK